MYYGSSRHPPKEIQYIKKCLEHKVGEAFDFRLSLFYYSPVQVAETLHPELGGLAPMLYWMTKFLSIMPELRVKLDPMHAHDMMQFLLSTWINRLQAQDISLQTEIPRPAISQEINKYVSASSTKSTAHSASSSLGSDSGSGNRRGVKRKDGTAGVESVK